MSDVVCGKLEHPLPLSNGLYIGTIDGKKVTVPMSGFNFVFFTDHPCNNTNVYIEIKTDSIIIEPR